MNTKIYMLTETSEYMMSFVIVTKKNNIIIVDGGRKEDMPLLKKYVKGRHISAWILSHAHEDHISGLVYELEKNNLKDFDVEKIYFNFPDYDYLISKKYNTPDPEYFVSELNEILPKFNSQKYKILEKTHIVKQGEKLDIDEVNIEFLFTYHDGLYANLMNDASLVFRLRTNNKSMLFLGDLGPDGGDVLFRESRDKLKSDYVQMAHHGHANVSMEVYAKIMPTACFWTSPVWLYNEKEVPYYLSDVNYLIKSNRIRLYGTAITREWMNILGVVTNYVSGEGTVEVDL